MQLNIESNHKLIERFPFLIPRNRWTGKVPEDYDYSYTELDSMPDGWRKAFGEQMCVFPRVFDVVFLHRAGAAVCVRYADGGRRGKTVEL